MSIKDSADSSVEEAGLGENHNDRHDAAASDVPFILRTSFLGGIFLLLLLYALRMADILLVPIVSAVILKMVFQPVVRTLAKLKLPNTFIAAIIVIALLGAIATMVHGVATPAMIWSDKIHSSYSQLHERLNFIRQPVEKTQKILVQAEGLANNASSTEVVPVAVEGTRFYDRLMNGTQSALVEFFTMILILFSLLSGGDTFLRRSVELLPRFKDKRQAVHICQKIEADISGYLFSITWINLALGACVTLCMWFFHITNPIMWGAFAFILNYIPFLGPIVALIIFAFVGMVSINQSWIALLPAAIYFILQLLEGNIITPLILAKRFTLNPVLIMLSIIFWYWMWGIVGAVLAMPMLAICKAFCDHIDGLKPVGHFLEG